MNIIIITEFILISLLYITNINQLINFLSNIKRNRSKNFVSLLVYIIFSFSFIYTELYFSDSLIRLPVFTLYYFSMINYSIRVNKECSHKKSVYITFLYISIDSIIQSIVYLCFENNLLSFDKRLIMRSISLIVNLVIYIIMKYIFLPKSLGSTCIDTKVISNKTYILILTTLLLCGILLENQLIDINESAILLQAKFTKLLTAICIPLLILIIISLLFNCITKSYYQNTSSLLEKQIDMQLDYYNKLEKKNSELREFRHDFKNHMLCLQSLIDNHDCEEASQYIQKITNRSYSEPAEFYTGNKIADAILADKSALASEFNAEISFDGEIFDGISAPDICIILSNALDNAIEACSKISHTNKSISVKCIFSKGVQIINISNPTVDTDNITENSFHTTKDDKDNHGYGLYNIKKTVDMYNGMFSINCTGGIFTLEVGLNVAAHISQGL